MMNKRTLLIVMLMSFFPLYLSSALALTMTPYYSYSEYYGQGGVVHAAPNTLYPSATLTSEHDSEGAAGATSVAGGQEWWGTVSLGAVSAQGWGDVTSNPLTGTISSRSGAHHTDTGGDMVSYWVDFSTPPFEPNPFRITPYSWGLGSSFGYIRMLWEIGTDGTLEIGDNVNLAGSLNVEGAFDGEDDITMRTTMMVNQVENAYWLDGGEYTNYGLLADIILPDPDAMNSMLWFENESRNSDASDSVDISISSDINASVGDVILMEAMLETYAELPNDGIGRDIWAEFANTMETSLITDTQGAFLQPYGTGGSNGDEPAPVPEPSTILLLGSGLAGMAWYGRKRRRA